MKEDQTTVEELNRPPSGVMLTEKQLQMTAYMEANKLTQMKKNEALISALELIYEIMTYQVNDVDECEKFLRAYAPELLFPSNVKLNRPEANQ